MSQSSLASKASVSRQFHHTGYVLQSEMQDLNLRHVLPGHGCYQATPISDCPTGSRTGDRTPTSWLTAKRAANYAILDFSCRGWGRTTTSGFRVRFPAIRNDSALDGEEGVEPSSDGLKNHRLAFRPLST